MVDMLYKDIIIASVEGSIIPQNAATERVICLLRGLDRGSSGDDINNLLEDEFSETSWAVINSSHWPKDKDITMETKDALCQHLIHHEAVESRRMEMDEFRRGLQLFGFLEVVKKHAELMKPFFIAAAKPVFGSKEFVELIDMRELPPEDFAKKQAYEWFMSLVEENEISDVYPGGSVISSLLSFCTGSKSVPFGGFESKLTVNFLQEDDEKSLPTTSACLLILNLPTVHSSKSKFFESMKLALQFGSEGFGIM